MSKTKTLFTVALLVLLGSLGAAQAQVARYELQAVPKKNVRQGGLAEESAAVYVLFSGTADMLADAYTGEEGDAATVILRYSAPIMAGLMTDAMNFSSTTLIPGEPDSMLPLTGVGPGVVVTHKDDDNDGNGTIMIRGLTGTGSIFIVNNILLDVSEASGPVTVTAEISVAQPRLLIPSGPTTATVIDAITLGVTAKSAPVTVRTRGTTDLSIATLTITEGFKGAFEPGDTLELEVAGLQKGVELQVNVAATDDGKEFEVPADNGNGDPVPVPVASGTIKLTGDADGEDQTAPITLGTAMSGDIVGIPQPTEITVTLTLTATPMNDDVTFPLNIGDITARVTFMETDMFVDAFTPSADIFNIRSAQCELLFPVVSVLPNRGNWDTAISVNNPAYTTEMASGGLKFTFYGMGGVEATYDTTVDMITGVGLEADGTLAPGGTYQVMSSQILAATDWGLTFQGHVHLIADYTNCSGLGWVTDFMTVNQAYTATVIDNDTGTK